MIDETSVSGIPIRDVLRRGDVEEVVRLHGALYSAEHGFDEGFERYVAEPLARFAASPTPRERMWLAEREGRIVGCIAIVEASERDAQLRWFLVDPAVRRKGFGTALLDGAISFAREHGYRSIFLWTVSALAAAARLYAAAGFAKVEEKPGAFGVEVVEERWVLELERPPR